MNGGWHFRPYGWTIDAKRVASDLFADNGDDSHQNQWLQMDGVSSSFYESRLWDRYTGIQSISTIRGLQLANANGIPVYQIDQTNAAALLSTLNVFPDVLQNVQNEVNAGDTVIIPRDTIVMNQWVGSVWIDQLPDGSAGYLIEGGLFGGSTTQDPKDRQNTNPSCSDLNAAFDSQSGNFDSDINRAVAMRESGWTQFDGDGDPLISQNKNKSGQVTSADIGIMQVNDNNDGQTVTLPDGTHVVIDQQRLANDWQYNVQIGSAILNNDLVAAQRYLQGLGVSSPSNSDLATVAYYMYNHGSNVPPGFDYENGVLTPISYEVGDTFTNNGKTRTVTQGVLDGQQNALAVQNILNNQSWLNATKGCHP